MHRRDLLQAAAAAAAIGAIAKPAWSQTPAPPADQFSLDAYSRNLQWLRTPPELAKGVIDLGLKSVDLTVAPRPGHVDPARVRTELPAFVNGLRQNGVAVTAITTPIVDADTPNAEAILEAAASAGIRYYGWSGLTYDPARPYNAQLEALKPRLAKLVALNQKYRIKGLYQPRAGAENVGAAFFDMLELMRAFDPAFVGFRYDTAALLQTSPQTTAMQMRMGGPYIGGVALNDGKVTLDLPEWDEGHYTGTPEQLMGMSSGGDNVGRDGGDPLAIGGGGRPLPYRFHPVPVGTGMIDLTLIGKTLKEIGFNGPAETQVAWPLDGVENGADSIKSPRLAVLGRIKRDRLIVEQAFADTWGIDVARPAFMRAGARPAAAPGGGDD